MILTKVLYERGASILRKSGVLLHLSSLPQNFGVGTFGRCAYEFVDFLKKSGQKIWQILPLGPTGYGDSPYQSLSTFALNGYFIDFDMLCEDGLLRRDDVESICWGDDAENVDYGILYREKRKLLSLAYENFVSMGGRREFNEFIEIHSAWLIKYAAYMSIKNDNDGAPWYEWDISLSKYSGYAVEYAKANLKSQFDYYMFEQYTAYSQWQKLKDYATSREIEIMGDIPIYLSLDSVEVWANPELFEIEEGKPTEVSGCPPDSFSEKGQLWGNPLYNWEYHKDTDYKWWTERFMHASKLFDSVRIDHFRGFEAYYAIPFGNVDATEGRWRKGPGIDLFNKVKSAVPKLYIIAENLGFLTDEVQKLLDDTKYPGMAVLQFAFDDSFSSNYLPHNLVVNQVLYTGTHDNDTTRGWASEYYHNAGLAAKYLGIDNSEDLTKALIRVAYQSVCDIVIIPMQDFLVQDSSCRMNTPSIDMGNWTYRITKDKLSEGLSDEMSELVKIYGRG